MTSTSKKILAVVADKETSSHVMAAAIERMEQADASLVVVHVMPQHVYDGRSHSHGAIPELKRDGFAYSYDQAMASAENVAKRVARAAIGDRDIPYTPVGRVGDLVSTVLAVSATHGCDTILLQETSSLWRRVIGLADRRFAKRFDGTIIRVPRHAPENLKTTRSRSSENASAPSASWRTRRISIRVSLPSATNASSDGSARGSPSSASGGMRYRIIESNVNLGVELH